MSLWERVKVWLMGVTDKGKDQGDRGKDKTKPVDLSPVTQRLDTIIGLLNTLVAQTKAPPVQPVPPDHSQDLEDIMSAVSDLTDAVNRQGTVIDSAITLLSTLAQQIRDNVDNSEALNQLAADIDANTQELAQAVDANDGEPNPPVDETPPVDPNDVPHPDQTLPGDLPQG